MGRAARHHGERAVSGYGAERKADAAAESFFAVLKAETGTTAWDTRAQARQDVLRRIVEHHDRDRIHSTIGCITPYQERLRRHQRLGLAA